MGAGVVLLQGGNSICLAMKNVKTQEQINRT